MQLNNIHKILRKSKIRKTTHFNKNNNDHIIKKITFYRVTELVCGKKQFLIERKLLNVTLHAVKYDDRLYSREICF